MIEPSDEDLMRADKLLEQARDLLGQAAHLARKKRVLFTYEWTCQNFDPADEADDDELDTGPADDSQGEEEEGHEQPNPEIQ